MMKYFVIALPIMAAAASAHGQLLIETFETDGNGTRYYTSIAEFIENPSAYFTRTDGSDIGATFTGPSGYFFAAQDINAAGAGRQQTLIFPNLDVNGFSSLVLSMTVAEDDAADGKEDWDADDFVHASFVFDGVTPTGPHNGYAIWFDGNPAGSTTDFNSFPSLNSGFIVTELFDGDSGEVSDEFILYSNSVPLPPGTLVADLVITFDLNHIDEDFAIDNVMVTGHTNSVIPEPATAVLVGLCGVVLLTHRRRAR